MHDVGMNTSQLEASVKQVDEAIELACTWSRRLLDAVDAYGMERIGGKLEDAARALDEARAGLQGYEDAIKADHNAVGTVKLV